MDELLEADVTQQYLVRRLTQQDVPGELYVAVDKCTGCEHCGGETGLHVLGADAPHDAVMYLGAEGWIPPVPLVAGQEGVEVRVEQKDRRSALALEACHIAYP